MKVQCPECDADISIKQIVVGRHKPICPECKTKFILKLEVMTSDQYRSQRRRRKLGRKAIRKLAEISRSRSNGEVIATQRSEPTDRSELNDDGKQPKKAHVGALELSYDNAQATGSVSLTENSAAETWPGTDDEVSLPETLGGYRILEQLGAGAMGNVFLAEQTSLKRRVAIKAIKPHLAANPDYLSRFTKEAFAAAQLNHHNVVQIYDLRDDNGVHFFSMELVKGKPLSQMVSGQKPLAAQMALGFLLQAARGLQFAHDHGLVHRDVKPANLMLSDQGMVKVVDLGLVKNASELDTGEHADISDAQPTGETRAGVTLGTPAFMAPEQADDSTNVDHRADIYSLGCTLYVLLTGKPPFEGRTAYEILSKHKSEPVKHPDRVVDSIPLDVSEITMKMIAKRPEDRPASMNEVVEAIERLLSTGDSPSSRFGSNIEKFFQQYQSPALISWRTKIVHLVIGLAGAIALFLIWQSRFAFALSAILVPLASLCAHTCVRGLLEGTHLFRELRRLVFRSRWLDYLVWLGFAACLLAGVFFAQLTLPIVVSSIVGCMLGIALYFLVDRPIFFQRRPAVEGSVQLLRKMRMDGIEESEIQRIVADSCGPSWEELFEELFGYPAKQEMRQWKQRERPTETTYKHSPWRDRIISKISTHLDRLEEQRQERRLRRIETARLRAKGFSAKDASRKAAELAGAAAEHATAIRQSSREFTHASPERRRALQRRALAAKSLTCRPRVSLATRLQRMLNAAFGTLPRFTMGVLLVGLGVGWMYHNQVFTEFTDSSPSISSLTDVADRLKQASTSTSAALRNHATFEPLPFLPDPLGSLLAGLGPAVAGMLLILTSPCGGLKGLTLSLASATCAILAPAMLEPVVPEFVPQLGFVEPAEVGAFAIAGILAMVTWLVAET